MIMCQAPLSALQIIIPIFTCEETEHEKVKKCLRSHLGRAGIQTQVALAPGSAWEAPITNIRNTAQLGKPENLSPSICASADTLGVKSLGTIPLLNTT